MNPALTARIILMNSFPAKMTAWTAPMDHSFSDAMTTATPLGVLSEGTGAALPSYLDMFLGNTGGCLGETCALALILGGIYLVARRVISPVSYTHLDVYKRQLRGRLTPCRCRR